MSHFSHYLWQSIEPLYQKILNHPFNIELANGTLNQARFIFYIKQDSIYLKGFAKALALIAERSRAMKKVSAFFEFSLNSLNNENSLHADFLRQAKQEKADSIYFEPSPACLAYTTYLIETSTAGFLEEAIAAVLPCFWVYREVGRHLIKMSMKENPYSNWIKTYACEEFSKGVEQAISILDDLASHSPPHLKNLMKLAFQKSTELEWLFWEDAYHGAIQVQ